MTANSAAIHALNVYGNSFERLSLEQQESFNDLIVRILQVECADTPQDLNLAIESLKAPMPSRTDLKNTVVIHNTDKHPVLVALDAGPEEQTFVRARVSTQLIHDPQKNKLMSSDYDGSHDQFSAGSQRITKCAMPVTFVRYDNEKEIHKPSFDKIHAARESKKTWVSLGLDPNLVTALRNIGYKRPLPTERVAISGVQEGISTFIAGSSGRANTTATLIASIDLVMKNLSKMPKPQEVVNRSCAPIVVMVVPSHDLAESAYADIISFVVKSDAGLDNYTKPVTVYGSINRYKNMELLRSDANIVTGTPGRLADVIENRLISSANLRLLIFDQASDLGGGSFRHAMHCIKDWAKGLSADSSEETNPRPGAEVPCMVLSQMLDLREPREAALHQNFIQNLVTSKAAITIRFHDE